ncbi:OapC/ArvC family zinc-ribbon domain-containing protein [Natrialbaceae archaeon AArc-T1-2]|uniref:OapC/ArvC family zinc-ribbon domain-containing protein n=1 Tax=Natrialbaceae archaeon AArc-T1-2 TaxID=3053904 RepID=UPI00255AA025|nr:Zn-ribbon containing protein [Natrialbaceae archaeon AArc-T1-2]WIV68530.1 Zn-ribbon containing protein [Natrialbaceae archaeon AArc-T1-2]
MPHQCTNCGREFEDGSKEMLSGCPSCDGNTFQFVPKADAGDDSLNSSPNPNSSSPPPSTDGAVSRAAETVREWVSDDDSETSWPPADEGGSASETFPEWPESARRPEDRSSSADETASVTTEPTTTDESADLSEDTAQTDARSELATSEEIPSDTGSVDAAADASSERDEMPPDRGDDGSTPEYGQVVSEPSADRPSLEELRDELNDQFESIKIVSPGQYELNLMELYNREEYIVSLQEDGRYVIDVPDSWRNGDE